MRHPRRVIAVLEHHREVICTKRFSVDEDDDDRKLPARREVPCVSPPMDEDYNDTQPPKTGANQIKSVKPPDVGFLCVSQRYTLKILLTVWQ
jgi:hypothetical protein